jgi:hypothetical protein
MTQREENERRLMRRGQMKRWRGKGDYLGQTRGVREVIDSMYIVMGIRMEQPATPYTHTHTHNLALCQHISVNLFILLVVIFNHLLP